MEIKLICKNSSVYSTQKLLEASKSLNHEMAIVSPENIEASVGRGDIVLMRNTGIDYSDNDLDVLESMAANNSDIVIVNSITTHRLLRDKWLQYDFLRRLEFPVVKSYKLEELDDAENSRESIMLKTIRGNGGHGVWRISKKEICKKVKEIENSEDRRYFWQEHIDIQNEYKLFYCFGELFYFKKLGGGNLALGLELKEEKHIPNNILEMIKRLSENLSFEILSCDFLEDSKGEIYLLEVNSVPGFASVDKCLKVQIADKIIDGLSYGLSY